MAGPVKQFRAGTVSLAVWENIYKGKDGEVVTQSYTLSKSYKDPKTGDWKNSNSLKSSELIFAIMTLQQALEDKYLKDDANEKDEF